MEKNPFERLDEIKEEIVQVSLQDNKNWGSLSKSERSVLMNEFECINQIEVERREEAKILLEKIEKLSRYLGRFKKQINHTLENN